MSDSDSDSFDEESILIANHAHSHESSNIRKINSLGFIRENGLADKPLSLTEQGDQMRQTMHNMVSFNEMDQEHLQTRDMANRDINMMISGNIHDRQVEVRTTSKSRLAPIQDPETLSAIELRRQANRLIQQRRRMNETAEAKARRLANEAQARRISRANESEEHRRERLRKNADAIRRHRAEESPDETAARKQKMAEDRRRLREKESEEERMERLRRSAEARRLQRANESEEAKAARRMREALARRLARSNETDEDKVERRRRALELRQRSSIHSSEYLSQSDKDAVSVNNLLGHDRPQAGQPLHEYSSYVGTDSDEHYELPGSNYANTSTNDMAAGEASLKRKAHRLARATETTEARDRRLMLYNSAHDIQMSRNQEINQNAENGTALQSTEMDQTYENQTEMEGSDGREEHMDDSNSISKSSNVAVNNKEPTDSEAVRQQIFRKKYRPHLQSTNKVNNTENHSESFPTSANPVLTPFEETSGIVENVSEKAKEGREASETVTTDQNVSEMAESDIMIQDTPKVYEQIVRGKRKRTTNTKGT